MTPPSAAAAARTRTAAPRPRRVSGPAARPRAVPAPSGSTSQRGLVLGLAAAIAALTDSRHLDRLIRGRLWIGLVAFALIGIVTLQLLMLQLNAGIGRAILTQDSLQRENSALSIENSELSSGDRVEGLAARMGMELEQPGVVKFLRAGSEAQAAQAAHDLTAPSQTATGPAQSAAQGESAASTTQPLESSAGASSTQGAAASTTPAQTEQGAAAPTAAPQGEQAAAAATGAQPSSATQPSGEGTQTAPPALEAGAASAPQTATGG